MHSANLMHRDYKPSNVLIDGYSRVMICDYGMARTVPKLTQEEKRFKQYRKDEFKAVLKSKDESTRATNYKNFKGRVSHDL